MVINLSESQIINIIALNTPGDGVILLESRLLEVVSFQFRKKNKLDMSGSRFNRTYVL
jgi:hypothetical protein